MTAMRLGLGAYTVIAYSAGVGTVTATRLSTAAAPTAFDRLNPAQCAAAQCGDSPARGYHAGPLPIIAGVPHLDGDDLALSTRHAAKGQEWDAVFVLDMAFLRSSGGRREG